MSLRVGKIFGVAIRVHYSLLLIFFLVAFSLAMGYMPEQFPGLSQASYWAIGIISGSVLIISVLIHELCHSVVANRLGLPVRRITLFFLGGASELPEEPKNPETEFKMAVAGPLSSFIIAIILGAIWYLLRKVDLMTELIAITQYGASINAILGGFNLLPAFPLDGGRVLRSVLWMRRRSLIRATRIATRISAVLSYLLMFGGFVMMIFGGFFNGLWIIFIGFFVRSGAETGLSQTIMGHILSETNVEDIMSANVVTVDSNLSLDDLVRDFFFVRGYAAYPVTEDGAVVGMVSMDRLKGISKTDWQDRTVKEVMKPLNELVVVEVGTPASDAMYSMSKKGEGRVLVMDGGRLMGMISRKDLTQLIKNRVELEQSRL